MRNLCRRNRITQNKSVISDSSERQLKLYTLGTKGAMRTPLVLRLALTISIVMVGLMILVYSTVIQLNSIWIFRFAVIPVPDYVQHITAFALLSFLSFVCWKYKKILVTIILGTLAVLLEVLQLGVEGRFPTATDAVYSIFGIMSGAIAFWLYGVVTGTIARRKPGGK